MSLDLLKNALYQAVRADIPGLVVYPEVLPDVDAMAFPNLAFEVEDDEHQPVRPDDEWYDVPSGLPEVDDDTGLANPAFYRFHVLARFRSRVTLHLRDSLGKGPRDEAAYLRIREQETAVRRFLVRARSIDLGTTASSETFAELWFRGGRQAYDRHTGLFLAEYDLDVDPWRLLEPGPGTPLYLANQISVDVARQMDGRVLVTRAYAQP